MSAVLAGSKKEQIKSLLKSTTIKPSEIALAVGCEQSYINELMEDPDFAQEVVAARVELLKGHSERDRKYDSLEDKLIAGLEIKLEQGAALMKTETLLRAVTTINSAKRRGQPDPGAASPQTAIVNLTIPSFIFNQYKVDSDNQVISIGDRALITMPAKTVMDKLKQILPSTDVLVLEDKTNVNVIDFNPARPPEVIERVERSSAITADQV